MDPGSSDDPLRRIAGVAGLLAALRNLHLLGHGPSHDRHLQLFDADDGQAIPVRVLGHDLGRGDPPIVLVHGLGCSHRHWMPVALGHIVLLLGLHFINVRYLLPLVLLSLLWVAKGIDGVTRWGVGTASQWGLPTRRIHSAISCVLIVAVVLLASWGVRWGSLQDQGPSTLRLKDIGAWLAEYRPGPKRVMTVDDRIPYYSGGTFLPMPYAEPALALRYVHEKHPDFIVLVGERPYLAPYIEQWLREGIPDQAAKLIYRADPASPTSVTIYEWRDLRHQ